MGQISQSEPIRWGIAGSGGMASAFARGLALVPGARLHAFGCRTAKRAEELAGQFGAHRAHGSFDELMADDGVDVVYIATINTTHHDLMIKALDAGRHVLCEKPFTLTAAQAQAVIEKAREKKLFCMEAMWMRFLPAIGRLKQLVEEGSIGEPRLISAQIGFPYEVDHAGRLFDPRKGGGALLDLGVYALSLAQFLFGDPESVSGEAWKAETGADVASSVVARFSGDRLASLVTSIGTPTPNRAVVMGTAGMIEVGPPFFHPTRLTVQRAAPIRPGAGGSGRLALLKHLPLVGSAVSAIEPLLRSLRPGGPRTLHLPYQPNGYQYEAIEAMRCLREGRTESPTMPLSQTLRLLEATDHLRQLWGVRYPHE